MQLHGHPRYMGTIYMLRHHNVSQESVAIGRSCLSDLLPSPCFQGWTWCSFSPLDSASCAEQPGDSMVTESSIHYLGQPSLLLRIPLQSLMVLFLSQFFCLHLHLLHCLTLCLLYQNQIPRSQECLVRLARRPDVPLHLQWFLPDLEVWQWLLLRPMIQKV